MMPAFKVGEYVQLHIIASTRKACSIEPLPDGVYQITEYNNKYGWCRLKGCPRQRTYPEHWFFKLNTHTMYLANDGNTIIPLGDNMPLISPTSNGIIATGSGSGEIGIYTSPSITQAITAEESKLTKERSMSISLPVVKKVTLINNRTIETYTEQELFQIVAAIDAEVAALEKHTTKPLKLLKRIEALKAENAKLVELIDAE